MKTSGMKRVILVLSLTFIVGGSTRRRDYEDFESQEEDRRHYSGVSYLGNRRSSNGYQLSEKPPSFPGNSRNSNSQQSFHHHHHHRAFKNHRFDRSFGTLIGRLSPRAHGIHGVVYAVDETHLLVRNFRYDGTGPDAYFWVGDDNQPSPKGHMVPYPPIDDGYDDPDTFFPGNNFGGRFDGTRNRNNFPIKTEPTLPPTLKKMRNENVLLTLPGSLKISDIKWLAVWCVRFTVSYGFVLIPPNLKVPRQELIEAFPNLVGKLTSGRIKILDSQSFYIPNLQLNLKESGYHFWVGNSTNGPDEKGQMVPDEKAQMDDLQSYNGNDIIITLPNPLRMYDINYLSIYSLEKKINLGHVTFNPKNLMIPPALGQTKKPGWWFDTPIIVPEETTPFPRMGGQANSNKPKESRTHVPFNPSLKLPNCRELLGRKIRLLWKNEGGHIYFRIKVHMDKSKFAAVGIAPKMTKMIDADTVKIYYNSSSNKFEAVDSFLSKTTNCDFEDGLCEDVIFNSGNDVRYMGSIKNTGLSIVDFRRSILPKDAHDAPIALYEPTQVIVAIGSNKPVAGPYNFNKMNLEKENTTINFSSDEEEANCPDVNSPLKPYSPPEPEEVWKKSSIRGRKLFVARLGPPGGRKGYGAITGNPPLINVVWWINGKLMPEIYVERGKTYYFRVQGGDDSSRTNSYHPLYITDNVEGGYILKPQYERSVETVYSGIDEYGVEPVATGVGPLCEFVSDGADKTYDSQSFNDYKKTLKLACTEGREMEYGWVNWTVDHATPDLLYYQSFADYAMGWKIHVLDEGEVPPDSSNRSTEGHIFFALASSTLILFMTFFRVH